MILSNYHAKYYAHELTRQVAGNDIDRLSTSLFDASVDLNPHQIEAALFALSSPLSKGVILADEVGLGKTIEAGLVLCQYWAEKKRKLLVICPASLRRQWAAELSEKFNLPSVVLDAATVRKQKQEGIWNPFDQNKVVILSFHFAARQEEQLVSVPWNLVAIDEAHKLRNAHRQSNRIGQALRRTLNGRQKLLLTATPLQNSILELYGLTSLIDEHIFGDIKAFRKQYMHQGGNLGELRERLATYVKRTLRRQVLEYVRYTQRRTLTQPFTPTEKEQQLYGAITTFLLREESYALPTSQRQLTTLILRKLLASSTKAVTATLERIHKRLVAIREKASVPEDDIVSSIIAAQEMEDEYLETLDEKVSEQPRQEEVDLELLEQEIEELEHYIALARSITVDGKTTQVVRAIEAGFAEMVGMGAARKAIIFTESCRTQEYLRDYLNTHGFQGKLVTFSGTNTDPQATKIYQQWLNNEANRDKVTGSAPVDRRTALIDYFRDQAEIMIATEAAAEGVNLQFCSLIINYDLPWNPQRIEQRIGRCHRYGQKHDVVVINFVNEKNDADRRVLELLTEKFNLFNGVFGASDEILGTIENGVDFEKRILEIYQSCRTLKEIEGAFAALQKELEDDINQRLEETRKQVLENFDEDIHDLLKLQLDEARERLDRVGRLFWDITRFVLGPKAIFDDAEHDFTLHEPPAPAFRSGYYRLIRKGAANTVSGDHLYRLTHPLGEYVLETARNYGTPTAELHFDISNHPFKISIIEAMKGQKGWMVLDLLCLESFQNEEHLVFSGVTDDNQPLDQETCEKMFSCYPAGPPGVLREQVPEKLEKNAKRHQQAVLSRIMEANNRFFQAERDKLEKWADDKILAVEQALADTKAKFRGLKREARQAETVEQQKEIQVKIRDLERKQRRQRQQIFDAEDEILEKRDALIDALEKRMTRKTEIQRLFAVRWHIV